MQRFNFNLFFALDAILNAKTLTGAGQSVFLSQPAMSVALKKLRAYFKDDLVVYASGEGAQLTALGTALRPRIREVIRAAQETLQLSVDFNPATEVRSLHLTAPDVVEIVFLHEVLVEIAREAPGISCNCRPFTFQPVDELFREPLDVAIVGEAFALASYPSEPLFEDTISCMVWSGNQSVGDTMTEAEYLAARHVTMYLTPDRLSHPVGAALRALEVKRNIVVRGSVYSSLPNLIIGTDLVATTLTRFARRCAETLPVRVLPVPVELPKIKFVAQWQPYRSEEPVIRWLVGKLKAAAARI